MKMRHMSLRPPDDLDEVELIRAHLVAAADIAREHTRVHGIDARTSAYETYSEEKEYIRWLNRSEKLYAWLVESRIPKNLGCGGVSGKEYIDCGADGYRMLLRLDNNITPPSPEKARQIIVNNGWAQMTGSTSQRLDQLQELPRARELLGPKSDLCSFVSDVLANEIALKFFKTKREREDHVSFNPRKMSLEELQNDSEYTLELSEELEYVLLHPTATGIVFCMHVSNVKKAAKHMLPWNGEAYIYVSLICAKSIRGSELMDDVKRLASVLGVNFILLSALGHVVFYYAKLGFEFADDALRVRTLPPELLYEFKNGMDPLLIPISPSQRQTMLEEYRNPWSRKRAAAPGRSMRAKRVRIG